MGPCAELVGTAGWMKSCAFFSRRMSKHVQDINCEVSHCIVDHLDQSMIFDHQSVSGINLYCKVCHSWFQTFNFRMHWVSWYSMGEEMLNSIKLDLIDVIAFLTWVLFRMNLMRDPSNVDACSWMSLRNCVRGRCLAGHQGLHRPRGRLSLGPNQRSKSVSLIVEGKIHQVMMKCHNAHWMWVGVLLLCLTRPCLWKRCRKLENQRLKNDHMTTPDGPRRLLKCPRQSAIATRTMLWTRTGFCTWQRLLDVNVTCMNWETGSVEVKNIQSLLVFVWAQVPSRHVSRRCPWMICAPFWKSSGILTNASKIPLHSGCILVEQQCLTWKLTFFSQAELQTTLGGVQMNPNKVNYTFLGHEVGRACLCALFGIGKSRLNKAISLQPDLRIGKDKSGTSLAARSVDAFLSILYQSVAETLPDRFLFLISWQSIASNVHWCFQVGDIAISFWC